MDLGRFAPTSPSSMVKELRRLAAAQATGELIACGQGIEIHLFLFRGRLAWGSNSAAARVLGHYLQERSGIDPDALREVIEDCRRTGRRFGETLVAWGLATRAEVIAALRAQLDNVLDALFALDGVPAVFLPRATSYDEEWTFALDELIPTEDAGDATTLQALTSRVPDLAWAAEVELDGEKVEIVGDERGARRFAAARDLGRALTDAGAVAAVVRSLGGAIVIAPDGARRWLLAAVPGRTRIAAVHDAIKAVARPVVGPAADDVEAVLAEPTPDQRRTCQATLGATDDVLACLTISSGDVPPRGLARDPALGARLAGRAQLLAPMVAPAVDGCFADRAPGGGALAVDLGEAWLVGTSSGAGTCWLAVSRAASLGFAFAMLASTQREQA